MQRPLSGASDRSQRVLPSVAPRSIDGVRTQGFMLSHLSIRNFALIDRLDLELDGGFVAVTGETGAGKSIVFGALTLLVGGRATSEVIRSGEETTTVQGLFTVGGDARTWVDEVLASAGIPTSDQLLIRRSVSRSGPNKVWINDTLATVALLSRALDPLVEIVGQHEHLTLTRPDAHRALIDRFGDLGGASSAYAKSYQAWASARDARKELEAARSARAERIDYVRFQLEELRDLGLVAGEYAELDEKLGKVRNLERLRELSHSALVDLQDAERSAGVRIGLALEAVGRLADTDAALADVRDRLADAAAAIEDIAADLSRYSRQLDENDEDLDTLERRHEDLTRAFRKYVSDEPGLIEKQAELQAELKVLTNFEEALESAESEEREARAVAEAAADKLSVKRAAAAKKLFKHVISLLSELGMPHASLELQEARERLTVNGWEGLEVLFSANQGEPVAPIGKIASGGELSRLMLAIKTAASASDRLQTYTFDEVDTGIGGATAEVVGRLLSKLAAGRQLLCVTHHPQIAAFADVHLRAEKTVTDGRTFSRLVTLDENERVEEVGRMLGGAEVTEATLELARAMLSSGAR